jgi:hypothetical protein
MWTWGFVAFIMTWVWTIHSEVWSMSEEVAVMEYQLTKIHEKLDWHTEKLEIIQGSQYEILKQIDIIKGK